MAFLFIYNIMGKFDKTKRLKVLDKYGGKCAYCGCDVNIKTFQVDHIQPVYRGSTQKEMDYYGVTKGDHSITNLNPSCKSCNASKSTFTIEKWRIELSLKTSRIRRDVSSFSIVERFGLIEVLDSEVKFYFEKEVKYV
jgi:hypothetical protein